MKLKKEDPSLTDRLAADVFELTLHELLTLKLGDYRWRLIAPEAVQVFRQAKDEYWSLEKLAEHLQTQLEEAAFRLKRYNMSEKINAEENTPAKISRLFQEWLLQFEADESRRHTLALDLSRLLSSQLYIAAQQGEELESVAIGLEGMGAAKSVEAKKENSTWGPKWKD